MKSLGDTLEDPAVQWVYFRSDWSATHLIAPLNEWLLFCSEFDDWFETRDVNTRLGISIISDICFAADQYNYRSTG